MTDFCKRLKEGLEIPKEDLPKLIDKMLSYKEH